MAENEVVTLLEQLMQLLPCSHEEEAIGIREASTEPELQIRANFQ